MSEKNAWIEMLEFLDGKTVKIDGISGKLVYTASHMAPNGLFYIGTRLEHLPDRHGKRTKKYQQTKRELRDDWVSEITDNVDLQIELARGLGFNA